jgi:hypothetical protein
MSPAPKKKTSPIVWILVGIAGVFVLMGIVVVAGGIFMVHKAKQAGLDPDLMKRNPGLAATKFLATVNPNIQVLSTDEKKGLITLKDKQTGKVVTMTIDAVKNGKITFQEEGKEAVSVETRQDGSTGGVEVKSAEGSMKFGAGAVAKLPVWVPSYPGAAPEGTFSMQGQDGDTGSIQFKTKDPVDKVVRYYQAELKKGGLHETANITSSGGKSEGGLVTAEDESKKRNVLVSVSGGDEGTTVSVTYTTKK